MALSEGASITDDRTMTTIADLQPRPLHGIPILLKDNISTADKMNNTAGSFALLGAKVPADSTIARKLRNAGAIILGKTVRSTHHLDSFASLRLKIVTAEP